MLHSVCDLVGLNRVTRKILQNGAMALAGMLDARSGLPRCQQAKPLIFLSTLGTTETCAQLIRAELWKRQGNEVVVFHTVGSGGQAMEEMLGHEKVVAVIDLSLHELGRSYVWRRLRRRPGSTDHGAAKGYPGFADTRQH